jgi:hypothetical protein
MIIIPTKVPRVEIVHGHARICSECSLCMDQWLKWKGGDKSREFFFF